MNKVTLGQRIRERRKSLHISQQELAARLHTDQKQISKYENDRNDPSASVIAQLAKELNTSSDWLLGLTSISERPLRGEGDLDNLETEVVELLRVKPPEQKQKIVNAIKALS